MYYRDLILYIMFVNFYILLMLHYSIQVFDKISQS